MVRRLLQQSDLADAAHFKGQQVELFWPEDDTWWLARIIKVSDCLGRSDYSILPRSWDSFVSVILWVLLCPCHSLDP